MVHILALPHEKIVDIGCSLGEMFGDKATNVDFISANERRGWITNSGMNIPDIPNFVQANAANLPFKDKEYDVAVLSEIIEHIGIDDPVKVVNEAQRIAKTVIICVPNEQQWSPEREPFKNPDHKRWYTEETLVQLCRETSLAIIELFKIHYDGWSYFIVYGLSKP